MCSARSLHHYNTVDEHIGFLEPAFITMSLGARFIPLSKSLPSQVDVATAERPSHMYQVQGSGHFFSKCLCQDAQRQPWSLK